MNFSVEELELICHSLYMTNNKLGYTENKTIEVKELSSKIQRRINYLLQGKLNDDK